MEQQWFFKLLERAKEEIKVLRSENKVMAARLEMFDNMISVFNAQKPQQCCGMAQDIVYDIDKTIAEFETSEANKKGHQSIQANNDFEIGSLAFKEDKK